MAQTATRHQCAQKQATPMLYFCPLEAEALGLNEAIVVARLRFWLSRTKHIFGGRPWVYNTYLEWQRQFPFWSVFTVKAVFRRLEQLGVLESTQHFNTSRWYKRKWYTLDEDVLAEMLGTDVVSGVGPTLVPNGAEPEAAELAEPQAIAMGTEATIEEQPSLPLDGIASDPIEGIDSVSSLSKRSTEKSSQSACAREPDEEARARTLQTPEPVVTGSHHGVEESELLGYTSPVATSAWKVAAWGDVDAAFGLIPEEEKHMWLDRAKEALREQGTPWLETCIPALWALAVKLWGLGIPVYAEPVANG